jgi:hypothetical protein
MLWMKGIRNEKQGVINSIFDFICALPNEKMININM